MYQYILIPEGMIIAETEKTAAQKCGSIVKATKAKPYAQRTVDAIASLGFTNRGLKLHHRTLLFT